MFNLKTLALVAGLFAGLSTATPYGLEPRADDLVRATEAPCASGDCTIDRLIADDHNSTLSERDLEARQSCSASVWIGKIFRDGGCPEDPDEGTWFSRCTSGSTGCVSTDGVLPNGFKSVSVGVATCRFLIYANGCSQPATSYIPTTAEGGNYKCWGGWGVGHGYAISC
ncbi:hypothetical protein GGR54DRAFT_196456 [Hypoxylon sp. NC1633]|nr:hypothetical protein GGR54DRAFT_196456 [Hypoxylon sp. NC1633]